MKMIIVLVICNIFASVLAAVPQQSRDPFRTYLHCSHQYRIGDKIICRFALTNTHNVDYSVLKIHTPLEGMFCAYLSVSRDGKALSYDGMYGKRSPLVPEAYTLVKAGCTIYTEIDLCEAYAINVTGRYSVQLKTKLVYHLGPPDSMPEHPSEQIILNVARFRVYGLGSPRMTKGEYYRQLSQQDRQRRASNAGGQQPLNPKFTGGTTEQREVTKQIHRATHLYAATAATDIDDNQAHYIRWFGTVVASRMQTVKEVFADLKEKLETTVYTYVFDDPRCQPGYYAFTSFGSTKVYLCGLYDPAGDLFGVDTKLCTVLHELTHAISFINDHEYGRQPCLDLAVNNPTNAIDNADSYCYFAETLNIFDYGFDSLVLPPNGVCYSTRGNTYLRYISISAGTIADGYPKLIRGNWGDIPNRFLKGFDSIATLPDQKTYATKGNRYVRYSDAGATTVDPDFNSKAIQGNWGSIPSDFINGFDSMSALPDGKIYVTKGNQYVRYSDSSANMVDSGYPKALQGNWGNLPADFAACFDSMAALPNGKTYVSQGKNYIRYSDASASTIDSGYPKTIRGNWGTINWPGPH